MRFGFRELIFVLLLVATPIASYITLFAPRNQMIAEARAEVRQKQAKLQQLEASTRSIEDLGAEIDKLSEAVEVFEQKLPAEREVEVILKQVWEMASKHQLTPKSVRTDKPVLETGYSELPIKMVILGDFDGFYAFLLDLEKLQRITRMPSMKLVKQQNKDAQDGQMQAEIILSIFFEPQDGKTPDGGSRS
ncbi:MAG: type 4a pilus biogenesis protein PilO [Phycisphaera sp.]|nr:type 4a pilus biogenesis protein PilO [Phycisphaera sp.]